MNTMITTRRLSLPNPIRVLLRTATEHLGKFFYNVNRVEWVLQPAREGAEARLHVRASSGEYHACYTHKRIGKAIRAAADAVERQRRRRKAVVVRRYRHQTLSHKLRPQRKVRMEVDQTPESFGWDISPRVGSSTPRK